MLMNEYLTLALLLLLLLLLHLIQAPQGSLPVFE
jgi:hypothetical protein